MAEVFRAKLPGVAGFEKILVIKRILPHLARNKRFVQMFVNEAQLAAKLQHQNVVQVYELGQVDSGELYIAMEYVPGIDLRGILRNAAQRVLRIPAWFSTHALAEVMGGLSHAHELTGDKGEPLNVVHRDVTPSNVFVSTSGEIKLADFGIAKAVGIASETRSGQLKGKISYMPPEQLHGQALDARADVFACGVVLWECLTQRRLFGGRPDFETMLAICEGKREPPSKYNPKVPPELDAVTLHALQPDRNHRISSAREFQARLLDVLPQIRPRLLPADIRHVVEIMLGETEPHPTLGADLPYDGPEAPPRAASPAVPPANEPIPSGQPIASGQPAPAGQPIPSGHPIPPGQPMPAGQPAMEVTHPPLPQPQLHQPMWPVAHQPAAPSGPWPAAPDPTGAAPVAWRSSGEAPPAMTGQYPQPAPGMIPFPPQYVPPGPTAHGTVPPGAMPPGYMPPNVGTIPPGAAQFPPQPTAVASTPPEPRSIRRRSSVNFELDLEGGDLKMVDDNIDWNSGVAGKEAEIYTGQHPFHIRTAEGVVDGPMPYNEMVAACNPREGSVREISTDGSSWVELGRFAPLAGLDYLAPEPLSRSNVVLVERLEERSLVQIFARIARNGWTGRLIIMESGKGRGVARRELDVRDGAPMFIYSDRTELQLPELIVKHKIVSQDLLPELLHQVAQEQLPLEEMVTRRAGVNMERYHGLFMRDRLEELFTWRQGKVAFNEGTPPRGTEPFAASLLHVLTESMHRSWSRDELKNALIKKMDKPLQKSERYEEAAPSLDLSAAQIASVDYLTEGRTLGQTLKKYPSEASNFLIIAYILTEMELLLVPL